MVQGDARQETVGPPPLDCVMDIRIVKEKEIHRIKVIKEVYIPAGFKGERVLLLCDTGSHITILTPEQFLRIPGHELCKFKPAGFRILQADGSEIKTWGRTSFTIQVGGCQIRLDVTVADVKHGILGMDFLWKARPTLDFDLLQLQIGGVAVQFRNRHDEPLLSRVVAAEDVWVPGGHRMLIPALIQGEHRKGELGILEPVQQGDLVQSGVLVARMVVEADKAKIVVEVINLDDQARLVRRGSAVAKLFPIDQEEIYEVMNIETDGIPSSKEVPEHIQELETRCTENMCPEDVTKVTSLLRDYQDVFSKGEYDLGRTTLVKHRIETKGTPPIRQPLRRSSPEKRLEIERQVTELLDKRLIEPSDSPWSSPVVLVSKKDGSKRLCLDYRKLNECTVKDAYPLPRIDDSLDALSGAKYFSTLDLASGYWQVELDPEAKAKSAFSTPSGLYQWNVLPFGLCNAPSTFERLMERVLAGLRWETLLVYLDDIIVMGSSVEESVDRLATVFTRLRGAGLKLKPSKCHLFQERVAYLGHVVSASGIETDPEKTDAIREWPIPTTKTEVRSFLGTATYYRRFVRGFADIARPLHRLTEKTTNFKWTPDCQAAFEKLTTALVNSPILAYPQQEGQMVLDTDASGFAIGSVLSQVQGAQEKVIAYYSHALKKEEQNYCVTRREMLAIIGSLKKFRHYLIGRRVKVRTDHGSLRWLLQFKNPEGQLARWLEFLSDFDLDLEYRPGRQHQNADGLSRRPCRQCSRWRAQSAAQDDASDVSEKGEASQDEPNRRVTKEIGVQTAEVQEGNVTQEPGFIGSIGTVVDLPEGVNHNHESDDIVSIGFTPQLDEGVEVQMEPITDVSKDPPTACVQVVSCAPDTVEMRNSQLADETIAFIMKAKEKQEKPMWTEVSGCSAALKSYWAQWDMLVIRDGVLCKRWEDHDGKGVKFLVVLPQKFRNQVLKELHSSKAAAHMGRDKTLPRLRDRYFWYGMAADVRAFLRKCVQCAQRKNPPKKSRAPLQQYRVGAPMERIAVDILGPLPETDQGNIYIMVLGDYWTRWMECYAIPDQQAETVAQKFVEEFVCRFGVPLELHSDQGRNFESSVFQEMCRILGITKTRTTPYNPKSDGMVERFNRTIINAVSLMIQPHQHQRDWDLYLPYVGMAYRSSVQASTQESPNMMMLGRETTMPIDLIIGAAPGEEDCGTDYAEDLRDRIRSIHERARHALGLSARRQKKNYDRSAHGSLYKEGQFVWLYNTTRKPGMSKKLALPWEGPYLVVQALSDVTLRIQKSSRSKPKVVHSDRLKIYEGPDLVPWRYKTAMDGVEQIVTDNHITEPDQQDKPDNPVRSIAKNSNPGTSDPQQQLEKETEVSREPVETGQVPTSSKEQDSQSLGRRYPSRDRRKPVRYR